MEQVLRGRQDPWIGKAMPTRRVPDARGESSEGAPDLWDYLENEIPQDAENSRNETDHQGDEEIFANKGESRLHQTAQAKSLPSPNSDEPPKVFENEDELLVERKSSENAPDASPLIFGAAWQSDEDMPEARQTFEPPDKTEDEESPSSEERLKINEDALQVEATRDELAVESSATEIDPADVVPQIENTVNWQEEKLSETEPPFEDDNTALPTSLPNASQKKEKKPESDAPKTDDGPADEAQNNPRQTVFPDALIESLAETDQSNRQPRGMIIQTLRGYKDYQKTCDEVLADFIDIDDEIHGAMVMTTDGFVIAKNLRKVTVLDNTETQITALFKLSMLLNDTLDLGGVEIIRLHGHEKIAFVNVATNAPLLIAWLNRSMPLGIVMIETQKAAIVIGEGFQELMDKAKDAK